MFSGKLKFISIRWVISVSNETDDRTKLIIYSVIGLLITYANAEIRTTLLIAVYISRTTL